jgi:hypothetical protein
MLVKIKNWVLSRNSEPDFLEKYLTLLYDLYYFVRVQRPVSALAGPMWERSRHYIEIDITYTCNLNCFNCNRSCGHAPTDEHVSLNQIRRFLEESITQNRQWKRIRLLGGEPTLHPQFLEILDEIYTYKDTHCPNLRIEVTTNGLGKRVNAMLARLRQDVFVNNTAKKSRVQLFNPFNLAPKDFLRYRLADFSCGCWGPEVCGFTLSPYGYFCCGSGAAIARVFGLDIGRPFLPPDLDSLRDQMQVLCSYCGHFISIRRRRVKDIMSPTWRQGYDAFKAAKPSITFYGDAIPLVGSPVQVATQAEDQAETDHCLLQPILTSYLKSSAAG